MHGSKWINDKKGCGANQFSRRCEMHYEIDRLMTLNIPENIAVQYINEKLSQCPKNGNSPFNNVIGHNRHLKRMGKARKLNQPSTHRKGRSRQGMLDFKMI